MMRNRLVVVFLALLVGGCTMLYTRDYLAEPAERLSAAEMQQVFTAFRDFLIKKGLDPLTYGEQQKANTATFRIGGTDAGFALRRDWADLLELSYSPEVGFRLRLVRIVHHPADFSEEYLANFVRQTEEFIREATQKQVRIKLLPRPGP